MTSLKCRIAIENGNKCQNCCFFCDSRKTCEDACGGYMEECEEQVHQIEEDDGITDLQVFLKDNNALQIMREIASVKKMMDDLEKKDKEFRKQLEEAMSAYCVNSFENEILKVTYVAPTTATSIDSAKLKKLHPDIAEECSKVTQKKGYVRIEVK